MQLSQGQKIAVLTGGTDGMGRLVAPLLAQAGFHVVTQGRSAARGKEVVDGIVAAGGQASFMACDLADLADVRRFANDLTRRVERIDVLINNAGIGTGPDGAPRETSADGLERRFAVNYLAPYLLTRLLLDKVQATPQARIVNVASEGQEPLDFDNMQLERDYSGYYAYCRSKVAVIMLTFDLAEELKASGVTANAMHPGAFMNTTMVREMNHEVVDSVDEGARHVFELATHPRFHGVTGRYINCGVEGVVKPQCHDIHARNRLRDYTRQLVGI
ncbi:MAG: hypothetical protein RIQ60_2748 [Pseudomonadota bacterium]|jgi:NAD(P)-dependent dehydrogenase (short-subunit alcohol dehydrogenase family)